MAATASTYPRFIRGSFLPQHFNIDLRWDARHPKQAEAVKQAMLNRLGLELVPDREPVEMLVMEKTQ